MKYLDKYEDTPRRKSRVTACLEIAGAISLKEISDVLVARPNQYYTPTSHRPGWMVNHGDSRDIEPICWRYCTRSYPIYETQAMLTMFMKKFSKRSQDIFRLAERHKLRVQFIVQIHAIKDHADYNMVMFPKDLNTFIADIGASSVVDFLWQI
jgi:hypothetical protein